jgi:hypothetical protein
MIFTISQWIMIMKGKRNNNCRRIGHPAAVIIVCQPVLLIITDPFLTLRV